MENVKAKKSQKKKQKIQIRYNNKTRWHAIWVVELCLDMNSKFEVNLYTKLNINL